MPDSHNIFENEEKHIIKIKSFEITAACSIPGKGHLATNTAHKQPIDGCHAGQKNKETSFSKNAVFKNEENFTLYL